MAGRGNKKSSDYESSTALGQKSDVADSGAYADLNPVTRDKPETTPYESLDLHQYDNVTCSDKT